MVQQALERGYGVNAYVRDASKLKIAHPGLQIFVGELKDYSAIATTVAGCDAVVCALGVPLKFAYPSMESLDGHRNIIRAMREHGVDRLIDWATPSVRFAADKCAVITVVPGMLAALFFPMAKKEIIAISDAITQSHLKWTIVRFVMPTDAPYSGKVKVGFGETRMGFSIGRADIAGFMIENVESERFVRSMPIIAS